MLRYLCIALIPLILFANCNPLKNVTTETQGDPKNAVTYGYQPLDPLPVKLGYDHDRPFNNKILLTSFPDETMRLAIGQIDVKGDISFGTAKAGYEGSSYIVILDYVKCDTKPLSIIFQKDSSNNIKNVQVLPENAAPIEGMKSSVVPLYVGVGLRFTATVKVNKGKVDLGNLFALGAAAEANQVTGTLVIQTLGISGPTVSNLIPMPSQLNTTTIQNAITSLAAIKATIYDTSVSIKPRVVGFYNNIGGGQETVSQITASILSKPIEHLMTY
jgi:hypothetical protein